MKTLKAALIGEHISRTRLPLALDLLCRRVGMTLDFTLIDTAERADFDFDATVADLRDKGWTGVTVTHPYKTDAARYAGDGMLPDLRGLGASNTLIFGDRLSGHNTDYTGFLAAWAAHMVEEPGRVAMAGAGGVARALGPALSRLGATDIAIWDKNAGAAQDLVDLIGTPARVVPFGDVADAIAQADGLVNATPLGMREYPGSAFAADRMGRQSWAFDAVYTPTNTRFLMDAASAGLTTLSGFSLFRHMAIRSFHAYTGLTVDSADVADAFDALKPD